MGVVVVVAGESMFCSGERDSVSSYVSSLVASELNYLMQSVLS